APHSGFACDAEALMPLVIDERRVVQHMTPAGLERPLAPFALLAVAEAERPLVEQPQLGERAALHEQTDAHPRRQSGIDARRALLDPSGEALDRFAGRQRVRREEAG